MRHHRTKKILWIAVGIVLIATVLGFGVMLLWNWLVPELFTGPKITFWQALGLFLLAKLMFGGVGRGGGSRCRNRWKDKMSAMAPEERERIKKRFMCKWSGDRSSTPDSDHYTPER